MKYTFTSLLILTAFASIAQNCSIPTGAVSDIYYSVTNNSIRGYFPPSANADHYLILRTTSPSLVPMLQNGTVYHAGDVNGNAVVVQYSSATAFVISDVPAGTTYYIWPMPVNDCNGSPVYQNHAMTVRPVTTFTSAANKTFFGNLHSHSTYSDGNQDSATAIPVNDYEYAKNSLCMDFLGISEHNHKQAGMHLADWQPGLAQARAARTPTFLSLYGMEWGVISTGGHVVTYESDKLFGWEPNNYNVYVPEGDYKGTPETSGTTGLFRTINNTSPLAFGTLAHPQDGDFDSLATGAFSPAADSAIVGCAVESGPATSVNNTYSNPPSYMYYLDVFKTLLARGYHVAPTIDHDNHNTTFGRTANSRLAFIAPALDSAGFYQAMRQRHFYATQSCNTVVDYTINNQMMGTIMSDTLPPAIVVTVKDNVNPTASVLLKIMKGAPGSGVLAAELTRTVGIAGALTYSDTALHTGQASYYYADITIGNKRTISAPIWYTRQSVVLPVKLLSFTALASGNEHVNLQWRTVTEAGNKYFILQRSANGVDFTNMITKPSTGDHSTYAYVDASPYQPLTYYRLQQVDFDGHSTYSTVVAVNFKQSEINTFSISPNPLIQLLI